MNLVEIEISQFLNILQDYSNNKLKNTEDIKRILEIVKKQNSDELFNKMLFSAKAFNGLMRIIKKSDNIFEDIYFNKLKEEIKQHTEILLDCLKEISLQGGTFLNGIFTEKYFQLTTESMQNLSSLSNDLEYIKIYINENK